MPAAIEGASRQVGDRFELIGGKLAARQVTDLLPHLGQHVAQPRARAQHRRDRVVELVREPGGHRTQRDQTLVPGDGVVGGATLDLESRQQVGRHGEPLPHGASEVGGGQLEQPAVGDRPCGTRVQLRNPAVGQRSVERTGVGAVVVGAEQLDLAALDATRHRHRPGEQHEEARGRRAFRVDRGTGRIRDDSTALGEPRELLVAQVLEQEQGPQLLRFQPFGHWCSRYVWRSWIAIAPSPTAEATRLIELALTSPAANTPGTLASR